VTADDWFQGDDGYWSIGRGPWGDDLSFFEHQLDDWPPLVALRAENARLRAAADQHLEQCATGRRLRAALEEVDE
jgi:hypothetical protein